MLGSKFRFTAGAAVLVLVAASSGCKSNTAPDTSNYKAAINTYYAAHPSCVWQSPVKFPAQADTSNDQQTKGFDALTDAGLLTRAAQEKKRFLIGSKQVNNYDISDTGRSTWTPDQTQPGYGNFCYGHREVTSIDSVTPGANQNGSNTATVNYHYDLTGVPDWAKSQEMQTAFPNVQTDMAMPKTATANLIQTQAGWQLSAN
ncbi:hypothetical protein [Acidobacterium sp. S8]|uniref:hypothetical protein n=1 Tax=Acidobacterium sp. S8 TaxID=1641854 RepID=UPI00131E7760|nr:hypothetical protein [Acidobacterium sp. S8]